MADLITIPRLVLQIAIPILLSALLSIFGWYLGQLYTEFHNLNEQVQDIDRTMASVTSRQTIIFERIEKRDTECVAHNKEVDRRFEMLNEKIQDVKDTIDIRAADRFTGKQGKELQELLGVQIGFLWDGLHDLRNDFKSLHDALRNEYVWEGRR